MFVIRIIHSNKNKNEKSLFWFFELFVFFISAFFFVSNGLFQLNIETRSIKAMLCEGIPTMIPDWNEFLITKNECLNRSSSFPRCYELKHVNIWLTLPLQHLFGLTGAFCGFLLCFCVCSA